MLKSNKKQGTTIPCFFNIIFCVSCVVLRKDMYVTLCTTLWLYTDTNIF